MHPFASLRQRNFRLFWLGQAVSVTGTWMQTVGQAWLVLQLTHSPFQLGLVGAIQSLPVLLFSLLGGVLADRWPKRRILLGTQSAAMIQALTLWVLVASGNVRIWHVYILALALGLTNCLDTPTRLAFVVELVGREELTAASALNSALFNAARIVGPGLGGVIIAATGVGALFLLNALSFLAVLLALLLIRGSDLHAQARHSTPGTAIRGAWQSMREGWDYVVNEPAMLWPIAVIGLVVFFGANFNVVLPLFATEVLHLGPQGFGFLAAASGAGSIAAGLWLAWINLRPTVPRVLAGMLVFCVTEAAFAVSQIALISLVLIATVGAAEDLFATLGTTMLQTLAPDHLRGRITGVYIFVFNGSVPVGYLMVGWLSDRFGPSRALLALALASLTVVIAGWITRDMAEPRLSATPTQQEAP